MSIDTVGVTGVTMAGVCLAVAAWVAAPMATPPAGAIGVVRAAAPMRANRAAHTATPLMDGRVLVAGGFTEKGSQLGSEVYDVAAARFIGAAAMVETRHSHTATRLPDGQVLIVGGYGAGTRVLSSAELFDPRTNGFTPAGALLTARADHVAVLLRSGQVLIAGGLGERWTYLSSMEVYDPTTRTFIAAGNMTTPRESHTAVRLASGDVLIAGGHAGPRRNLTLHASAEIFEAGTRSMRRVGDMRVRRHKHDAVLLRDQRVLVTGGSDERDGDGAYASTEVFDPARGVFAPGPAMRHARYKHQGSAVVLPDGRVLIAGGAAEAEVFDPSAALFAEVPGGARMPGLFSAVAPLDRGRVLITGGYGRGRGPVPSAWIYAP